MINVDKFKNPPAIPCHSGQINYAFPSRARDRSKGNLKICHKFCISNFQSRRVLVIDSNFLNMVLVFGFDKIILENDEGAACGRPE